MVLEIDFPEIMLDLNPAFQDGRKERYKEGVRELLVKVLPKEVFCQNGRDPSTLLQRKEFLQNQLPLLVWSEFSPAPCLLSIVLLTKYRKNVGNFFYDIISRWLIPQKNVQVEMFFASDFRFPELSEEAFTVAEILVRLESEEEIQKVQGQIKSLETEIRLGVVSEAHANQILEFKGLSSDRKILLIQGKIGSLIRSHSKDFGQNIFSHMQHFLVTCKEEFKATRDYHHISRIISVLYLLRKLIKQKMEKLPHRRHVFVKFLKTKLQDQGRERTVLGILVGLNFLNDHEIFEKIHLIKALKQYLPNIVPVENSFFIDRNNKNSIATVYVEIEKTDHAEFTIEEVQKLKGDLPETLKSHVGYLMHPIFMPRNEEEVVRNMLTLSQQLKYINDIPQVIISFDQQTGVELSFTVIVLRILGSKSLPVQQTFNSSNSSLKLVVDRVKKIGYLRRKYVKEATIFRAIVSSTDYLREDHTIDLSKARQAILAEMTLIFGEVRDYNGGMIYKQNESYQFLKSLVGEEGVKNERLLEQFFYAIQPVEMAVISKQESLKNLFFMLLNTIKREQQRIQKRTDWLFKQEPKAIFAIIPLYDLSQKREISDGIESLHLLSSEIASFYLKQEETFYLGYMYFSDDIAKQKQFLKTIQQAIEKPI
jgi:hypothetical protein